MPDRGKIIKGLECCANGGQDLCKECYQEGPGFGIACRQDLMRDAAQLLKAQEPRLVVKEDFVNADRWGYLPVYVEDRDGDMYWDCITDAALGDTVSRFWTTKPTDEQRKKVKWE